MRIINLDIISKTIKSIWVKCLFVLLILLHHFVPMHALSRENASYLDVDSIGDLWAFVVDASGSMKDKGYRKTWMSEELSEFIMDKLNCLHILDRPNYERDRFFIMYSGIYSGSIENNKMFLRNELAKEGSFTHHFIHPHVGNENVHFHRENLKKYLRTNISRCSFPYKYSCVSQIRTCVLDTIIHKMQRNNKADSFNHIYIVTITDDSDINDQWRKDYKEMLCNAPQRIPEINALNKRYIHNPFNDDGGGDLIEIATTFVPSPKTAYAPKVWLHKYSTLQQAPSKALLSNNELVDIAPMDGKQVQLMRKTAHYENDSIDFIYIDAIIVNGQSIPVHKYMTDSLCVKKSYSNGFFTNEVEIQGGIQVHYTDSVLGSHAKKIGMTYKGKTATTVFDAFCRVGIIIGICVLLFLLVYFMVILPMKRVMRVYTPEGHEMRVRRGYSWQWLETINPVLLSSIQSKTATPIQTMLAKHTCFRSKRVGTSADVKPYYWLIDSSRPFVSTEQLSAINTSMDMMRYVEREAHCPQKVKDLYKNWTLSKIDSLTLSPRKWVRQWGRFLQRCYHLCCPHYLYWVDVECLDDSVVVTSPLLPDSPFLFEISRLQTRDVPVSEQYVNRLLSQYYESADMQVAEVLVTVERDSTLTSWEVFQLQSRVRFGNGIGFAKHMMHYTHDTVSDAEQRRMESRIHKAICKEMHVSRVAIFHPNSEPMCILPFRVEKNAFMSYLYLVDDTIEQRSHRLYSPLSDQLDADNPRKMVALRKAQYDMELFTSLLPFKSGKDIPMQGAARRESTEKFPAGGAMQGELRINDKQVYFLNKNIKTH